QKVLQYQQTLRFVLNRAASRRPAASVCRASQADRAVLERAGSREPANRGLAHTVGARQIGLHSPVSEPLYSLLALVAVSLTGRPNFTPRALARLRPSSVRARISSRSNSARPPRTVSNSLPCGVVVSAQASASDLKLAPALATASRMLSKSLVDRASRSSRVTTSRSPASSLRIALASSGRSACPSKALYCDRRESTGSWFLSLFLAEEKIAEVTLAPACGGTGAS